MDIRDRKISIICPWFYKGDAVGHNANDHYNSFKSLGYKNIRSLGVRNDFPDMEFEYCENLSALENSQWFRDSDLVIYHFAIYHEFFNALSRRNKSGKHVVCFHNITPKKLMPIHAWDIIDKSFQQVQVFHGASEIWADSRENIEELLRQGVNDVRIKELPIPVQRPDFTSFSVKSASRIELICVGRFFESKGIIDIVEALRTVKARINERFIIRFVGNTDFSDQSYILELKNKIKEYGLGEYIDFVGKVDENTLGALYKKAHIYVSASYHEGFCVPVIEALRAGAIPITYDSGNLKWISGGLGVIIPAGNVTTLGNAILNLVTETKEALTDLDCDVLNLENGKYSANSFAHSAYKYSEKFSLDSFKAKLNDYVSAVLC